MASLIEITIAHGIDEYRVKQSGNWTMLRKPHYTWEPIPKRRVPPFVVIKAEEAFKYG